VCHGQKLVQKAVSLDVTIEKGVKNGHTITYELESNHVLDGFPGDVFVILAEKKHVLFTRDGDNLH